MSKTNVFTLIATILLGVLLFTIMRFERSLSDAPPADSIRETATPATSKTARPFIEPADSRELPRIDTHADLMEFLSANGVDSRDAIQGSVVWFQQRGFLGANTLLGVSPQAAPNANLRETSEEALRRIANNGSYRASQTLASRASFTDPFAAMDLYRTAAEQGSVYAIQRIGALLESLSDLSLDDFVAEPAYLRRLSNLRAAAAERNPNVPAFAHVAAASRDGGLPIIDRQVLQWMQRLSADFTAADMRFACEQSSQLYLEFGAARRQNGLQPISTEPPPVFLSIPELEKQLPCRNTPYPILQLLDLSDCSRTLVLDPSGERMDIHICRN